MDSVKEAFDSKTKESMLDDFMSSNDKKTLNAGFFEDKELKDLMALSDVVISRAGSNSIFELATLNKPMILVPLPNTSSRGEQTLNAKSFQSKGFGEIIKDEDISNKEILFSVLEKVYKNRDTYTKNMQASPVKTTSIEELASLICSK